MIFSPMVARVMNAVGKGRSDTDLSQFLQDTAIQETEEHIVLERRHTGDRRTFVVSSVFDRGASVTAGDKLAALVNLEAEKENQNLG